MRTISVVLVSLLFCLLALGLERFVGIDWDFHPDAATYVTEYVYVTHAGWYGLPNQMYFYIASLVSGSSGALIALNIGAYCLTNAVIASFFSRYARQFDIRGFKYVALLTLLLFAPYRIHLAVHGLKDTLIIACLFIVVIGGRGAIAAWFPLLLLRIYAALYALVLVPRRYLIPATLLGLVSVGLYELELTAFLLSRNEIDMGGRGFDQVPSFTELGLAGTVLRALLWPLLALSGLFVILSPTIAYAPLAVDVLVSRLWCKRTTGDFGVSLGLLLCLFVIALSVNTFTAYIRYCYPVIAVMPIVLLRFRLSNSPATASAGPRRTESVGRRRASLSMTNRNGPIVGDSVAG